MIVRDADHGDVGALTAIGNAAITGGTASWEHVPHSEPDRRSWLDRRQEAGWPVLVAEHDARVLGYASCAPFRPQAGWASTAEHSVYVAPEARGRGIGTVLLGAVIARARARGIHVLVGCLDAENDASVHLHRAAGFTEWGRLPQAGHKGGRWRDASFWALTLDDRDRPA